MTTCLTLSLLLVTDISRGFPMPATYQGYAPFSYNSHYGYQHQPITTATAATVSATSAIPPSERVNATVSTTSTPGVQGKYQNKKTRSYGSRYQQNTPYNPYYYSYYDQSSYYQPSSYYSSSYTRPAHHSWRGYQAQTPPPEPTSHRPGVPRTPATHQEGGEEMSASSTLTPLLGSVMTISTTPRARSSLTTTDKREVTTMMTTVITPSTLSPPPCPSTPCGPLATCTPWQGSFLCSCLPGYQGSPPSTPCTPVDHCAHRPCGDNTLCHNLLSGHLCQCLPGYFSSTPTVHTCQDVEECSSVPGLCGDNYTCTNTVGSYECVCGAGYSSHAGQCRDVDECSTSQHECGDHAHCTNTEGGYTCTCMEGFTKNGSLCEDIDECGARPGVCGAESVCINTAGSYECHCSTGLARSCSDTDEHHDVCEYTEDGVKCTCVDGYEGNPPHTPCTPVCSCGPSTECVRREGLELCVCKEGYEGDPPAQPCLEVDQCQAQGCGPNADCVKKGSGFTCSCKPGFDGNGFSGCSLPTICSSPLDCLTNTTCKQGTCQCKAGFYPAPPLCLDRDECLDSPDICGENSLCINIVGGYLCSCKDGYDRYPPLYGCSPVNPCRRVCGEHSACKWRREDTAFGCSCEEGFVELLSGGCVE